MPDVAGRELYVYYRVPADRREHALVEVHQAMTALCAAWPGLTARCLVRADEEHPLHVTCMEIYGHPTGIDAALQAAIAAGMAGWPSQRVGPRHLECFIAA